MSTVATIRIGTSRKPTSSLHQGVSDIEQFLKEARKIQRSQSSPSLCSLDKFNLLSPFSLSKEEKQGLSWSTPCIPVRRFSSFY